VDEAAGVVVGRWSDWIDRKQDIRTERTERTKITKQQFGRFARAVAPAVPPDQQN
jgi:hypothetical protein